MAETGLKASAAKLQAALDEFGLGLAVTEFPSSTRTSEDAAASIGCEVREIAKSLVFRIKASDEPLMVIASGINRVDQKKLKQAVGGKVGRADADFVREKTGFVIGGVPPLGHIQPLQILIDRDLMALETIWAAAGTPNAVFKLTPKQLETITRGKVSDIKED